MPDRSASQPLEAAPPAAAPAAARTLARVAGWGVVHFALLAVVVEALGYLWPIVGASSGDRLWRDMGWGGFALVAVVLAPVAETLWAQVLPLEACRRLNADPRLALLLSALMFGAGHLGDGPVKTIATFCSGLLLAWLYRRNRLERWTRGFAFTAGVHACSNALVTVALLVRPN
jgi:membrane protease YdiL (CAAX protease family)